jgi:acetyl esterase/lipase
MKPARQITFGRSEYSDLVGDLYRPSTLGLHPVIVGVPGGAWIRGALSDQRGR